MTTTQLWTEGEVKAAIAKAMEHEPEGPDRDYWTSEAPVEQIKAKYGLERFKPKPVTVTLVRECCGRRFVHTLTAREAAICLKDPRCSDPDCRRRTVTLPSGKFKEETLSWVYEQQPGYLAWFHETVEGCEGVKQAIRGLPGIEAHLAAFRQTRRQPSEKPSTPTQQEVERLMGKFSTLTAESVCEGLFGEE